MSDRIVPYDKSGFVWKMGRQLSRLPEDLLSRSIVFSSRSCPKLPRNNEDVLKQRIRELEARESKLWDAYNELWNEYEKIQSLHKKVTRSNTNTNKCAKKIDLTVDDE
jgi:peptidoglycan hydrolase CwlO-like protein